MIVKLLTVHVYNVGPLTTIEEKVLLEEVIFHL